MHRMTPVSYCPFKIRPHNHAMKRRNRRKIDTSQSVMAMHHRSREQLAPICRIGAKLDGGAEVEMLVIRAHYQTLSRSLTAAVSNR